MATITRDMILGDVTSKYPETTEVLLSYGLHCVGCCAAGMDTIEQGAMVHGMSEEQFEQLMKDLNEIVKIGESAKNEEPQPDEPIFVTDRAVKKVKEIMKNEGKEDYALRIDVMPGGCAGYSYQFTFDRQEEDDELVEKDGLKVVVKKEAFDMLKGCRVDFIDGLQGSGFRVDNPNATAGCGCGKSFR